MSYILDALRRAERERERGQVPGLHAQPEPVGLGPASVPRKLGGARIVAGAGVALGVLAAAFWWWGGGSQDEAVPRETARGAAAGAVTGGEAAGGPGAPTSADNVAAATPVRPEGPPLLVAPPPPPPPSPPPPPPRPAPAAPRPAAATAPTAPAAPSVPGTPPAATPAPARPTPLDQLAPAQRAELPQMRIGGAIYSDQPASRFIVINGLVVREGETAAPGVVLERIAPKSAVIRWRDLRIEMPI